MGKRNLCRKENCSVGVDEICGNVKTVVVQFSKKTIITTDEVLVTFDKNGIVDEEEEIEESCDYHLECKNCGKSASIFNFIEDIAEWVEE